MMSQPAIFLDRDGVLNVNRVDDVKSWDEFEWLPGSLHAIVELTHLNYPIFIVTNQRAISQKRLTVQALETIHAHMYQDIEKVGGKLTDILVPMFWASRRVQVR